MSILEDTKVIKRRKRPSLVCENCKRKKIKCDKSEPCSQCIKSNSADSCRYDPIVIKRRSVHSTQLPYVASAKTPLNFTHGVPIKEINTNANNVNRDSATIKNSHTSELAMLKERLAHLESAINSKQEQKSTYNSKEHQYTTPSNSGIQAITKVTDPATIPNLPNIPVTPNYFPNSGLLNTFNSSTKFLEIPSINNFPQTSNYRNDSNFRNIPMPIVSQGPNYSNILGDTGSNNYAKILNASSTPNSGSTSSGYPSSREYTSTNSSIGSTGDNYLLRGSISSLLTPSSISLTLADYNMKTSSVMNGVVPYDSESDTINFYENYTSLYVKEHITRVNFGPFAWSSIMNRDMGLRVLWDYVVKKKKEQSVNSGHFFGRVNDIANVMNLSPANEFTEKAFQKRALESDGYTNMVPYLNIIKSQKEFKNSKLSKDVLPLGLTYFEGQINRELQLIDKIQLVLPTTEIIWKHIDIFFTKVYPCFPFLDEECFRKEVKRIIPGEGDKIVLNVEKKLDLAIMGTLLIILRLSYLCLFCNKPSVNESYLNTTDPSQEAQDMKILLSTPINVSVIDVAQLCLDQFLLFRKPTFTLMQFALYFRIYHSYAPEDGDGADGGESQVYTSLLVQMAYSLGLNRDPDNFPDICTEKRVNNLSRKIWFFLLLSDTYQGYVFGNPMTTSDIYYDTKIPYYEEGCSNSKDEEMEKYLLECMKAWYPLKEAADDVLKLVLRVKEKTNMSELCQKLSKVETLLRDHCGDLADVLTNSLDDNKNRFTQLVKLKIGLCYSAFLFTIYFHFYLYYTEKKNNDLAFYYIRKIFLISTYIVMPNYFEFLGICNTLINPCLEIFIHKANQICLAWIVKINFTIWYFKEQPSHEKKLASDPAYAAHYKLCCQFSSCLTRCAEVSIAAISKISNRYYYAWRITKSHTYLLKVITNKEFYEIITAGGYKIPKCTFTTEMLQELIKICEIPLSKLGKSNTNIAEFCKDVNKYSQPWSPINKYASRGYGECTKPKFSTNKNENEFGLDYESCADIDNLWLQMLMMRLDNKLAENTQSFSFETPKPASFYNSFNEDRKPHPEKQTSELQRTHIDSSLSPTPMDDYNKINLDPESYARFDIFSDLPISDMLNY